MYVHIPVICINVNCMLRSDFATFLTKYYTMLAESVLVETTIHNLY